MAPVQLTRSALRQQTGGGLRAILERHAAAVSLPATAQNLDLQVRFALAEWWSRGHVGQCVTFSYRLSGQRTAIWYIDCSLNWRVDYPGKDSWICVLHLLAS